MQALWAKPARDVQGPVPHDRRRRDQSASGVRPSAAVVSAGITRRPCRASPNGATAGCPTPIRRIRPRSNIFAELRRLTEAGRPRSGVGRHRSLDVLRCGLGSRLAEGSRVLAGRRRVAYLPDDNVPPPSPSSDRRQIVERPSGRAEALSRRGRGHSLGGTDDAAGRNNSGRRYASAAYRKALELNPADVSAKGSLEKLATAATGVDDPKQVAQLEDYLRQEKYKEGEILLTEYVKERPTSSWGWYALGYSRFAQMKVGSSIEALAKSLELDIRNAEAHKILGRDLMIIGRFDDARIEFEPGAPLQAGLRRDSLQPGQALFRARQLGAGASGVRICSAARSVVPRGLGRSRLRPGSAGRRRRSRRFVSEGRFVE